MKLFSLVVFASLVGSLVVAAQDEIPHKDYEQQQQQQLRGSPLRQLEEDYSGFWGFFRRIIDWFLSLFKRSHSDDNKNASTSDVLPQQTNAASVKESPEEIAADGALLTEPLAAAPTDGDSVDTRKVEASSAAENEDAAVANNEDAAVAKNVANNEDAAVANNEDAAVIARNTRQVEIKKISIDEHHAEKGTATTAEHVEGTFKNHESPVEKPVEGDANVAENVGDGIATEGANSTEADVEALLLNIAKLQNRVVDDPSFAADSACRRVYLARAKELVSNFIEQHAGRPMDEVVGEFDKLVLAFDVCARAGNAAKGTEGGIEETEKVSQEKNGETAEAMDELANEDETILSGQASVPEDWEDFEDNGEKAAPETLGEKAIDEAIDEALDEALEKALGETRV